MPRKWQRDFVIKLVNVVYAPREMVNNFSSADHEWNLTTVSLHRLHIFSGRSANPAMTCLEPSSLCQDRLWHFKSRTGIQRNL
jgi:hypothetical protein